VNRTITTPDGVGLFTHEIGPPDAPAVVVLHGGPAAHHDYLLPGFARLADAFRVILYDQRGGGRSRIEPRADLSLAAHLADLGAVLDAFGLARADLVGYSFGGFLAMLFAARQAQSVTYNATPIVLAGVFYVLCLWPLVRLLSRFEHQSIALH